MAGRARGKNSLVGWDFAGICKKVGEQLEAEQPQRMAEQEAAVRRTENSYEGQHVYRVAAKVCQDGRIYVETREHPPLAGQLTAVGRNLDTALVNLRFAYAQRMVKAKLIDDIDTARRYATKATFVPEFNLPKIQVAVH